MYLQTFWNAEANLPIFYLSDVSPRVKPHWGCTSKPPSCESESASEGQRSPIVDVAVSGVNHSSLSRPKVRRAVRAKLRSRRGLIGCIVVDSPSESRVRAWALSFYGSLRRQMLSWTTVEFNAGIFMAQKCVGNNVKMEHFHNPPDCINTFTRARGITIISAFGYSL